MILNVTSLLVGRICPVNFTTDGHTAAALTAGPAGKNPTSCHKDPCRGSPA